MTSKNNLTREIPVKYGSSTYVVLCYLRMKNKFISLEDYRKFRINKVKPSDITRTFTVLVKYGLAIRSTDGTSRVAITERGRQYLFKVAQKDHRSE